MFILKTICVCKKKEWWIYVFSFMCDIIITFDVSGYFCTECFKAKCMKVHK